MGGCGRWGYEALPLCANEPGCEVDARTARVDAARPARGVDAGPAPRVVGCGSLQLLRETFDGGETREYWYQLGQGGAQAQLVDDRVAISIPAGVGVAEASLAANSSYDLRSSEITVDVSRVGGRTAGLELRDGRNRDRFGAFIGSSRGVALVVEDGQLKAQTLDGEFQTTLASVPHDGGQRFWRIGERDGRVSWWTSADRMLWAQLHEAEVMMDTSSVYPVLFARGQEARAAEAWFDDVNVPAFPVPGFCPASALQDDFTGALAVRWQPWNGAGTCTVRGNGNQAELRFAGDFSACSLVSMARYDLRDGVFAVELAQVPTVSTFQTLIELRTARFEDRAEVRIGGGNARMAVFVGGTQVADASAPFEPAQRFVRVRETAGRLVWEVSRDGSAWSHRADAEAGLDLGSVVFAVTGLDSGGNGAQVLRLDRVNRP